MIVMCSGGFDPLHIGHLRYLKATQSVADTIVVVLNSDDWLRRKKGYVFMPWEERAEIVGALYCVLGAVYPVEDNDGTVCEALKRLKPNYFANGGDRIEANPAEHAVCEELSIKELFNVGGAKIASSSDLVRGASLMYQNRKIKRVSFS